MHLDTEIAEPFVAPPSLDSRNASQPPGTHPRSSVPLRREGNRGKLKAPLEDPIRQSRDPQGVRTRKVTPNTFAGHFVMSAGIPRRPVVDSHEHEDATEGSGHHRDAAGRMRMAGSPSDPG
jgi:hypothetical protein